MSHSELMWLAGLFEGEASFDFQCRKSESRNGRIRIQFSTTDYDVAQRVSVLLNVRVNGPYVPSNGVGRLPFYRVMKSGIRIFPLWQALYPFMGNRRQQQMDAAWQRVKQQHA